MNSKAKTVENHLKSALVAIRGVCSRSNSPVRKEKKKESVKHEKSEKKKSVKKPMDMDKKKKETGLEQYSKLIKKF